MLIIKEVFYIMLKKFIFLFILITFSLPAPALELELSSTGEAGMQGNKAEVFKPSRMIIGAKTGFIIKAESGSYVSLVLAADENGEQILAKVDGIVGEKGITELEVELPEEKSLIDKVVYFEVAVWKNEDLSDIIRARIIGSDGRQTRSNTVLITGKPEKGLMPGFGPAMPGGGDFSRTMEALQEDNTSTDDAYYYNKPLILRNLRAPELKEQDEK